MKCIRLVIIDLKTKETHEEVIEDIKWVSQQGSHICVNCPDDRFFRFHVNTVASAEEYDSSIE